MFTQSHLLACPNDILFLIFGCCDHNSLHNLSLTNKSLRPQCAAHLYRNVDLSSHNIGRMPEFEDEVRPEIYSNTGNFWRPENLVSRQQYFLRTILEHPEYATYVHTFSWTLIWHDFNERELSETSHQIWHVFGRLTNVGRLDLASLSEDEVLDPYIRDIPPLLFPQVTELRLTGWMSHNLVANVLNSINVSKIQSLSLDTLQEEGQIPSGSPMPEDINKEYWDSPVDRARMKAGIIFPGPMWSIAAIITGRLDSLQHLEIRIPPLETSGMDEDRAEHTYFIDMMVELVESVMPTLKTLVIDYARDIQRTLRLQGTERNHALTLQSRRSHLSKTILEAFSPCFLSDGKWEWGLLRSVSVMGFLQENDALAAVQDIPRAVTALQAGIQNSLSTRGVTFEWSSNSPRPGVLFMGYDYMISEEEMNQFVQVFQQPELAK